LSAKDSCEAHGSRDRWETALRAPAATSGFDGMRTGVVRTLALVVVLGAVTVVAPPAQAREYEVTVLGGLRVGGQFEDAATGASRPSDEGPVVGLILGFPRGSDRTLELVWLHQPVSVPPSDGGGDGVDFALDTIGVGGTYEWGAGRLRPFVSATAGLALLSPDVSGYDLELLLAGSLGGGVKVALSERAAIRLEGRGAALLATGSAAGVCGGGGCALAFSGAGIGQLELLAGISISF
jgi:hypothetical protein